MAGDIERRQIAGTNVGVLRLKVVKPLEPDKDTIYEAIFYDPEQKPAADFFNALGRHIAQMQGVLLRPVPQPDLPSNPVTVGSRNGYYLFVALLSTIGLGMMANVFGAIG